MIELDKTTFDLEFDLSDVPRGDRKTALNDVAAYVIEEILNHVGQGKSPVSGVKDFKKLNEKYADKEKGGDRLANLDLTGSMLDSLTFKRKGETLTIGIFDEDEAPKSHGHNTGGGNLPKRQFIPDDGKGQYLKKDILRGIDLIISEYIDNNSNSEEE